MKTRLILGASILALVMLILIAGPAACRHITAMKNQARIERGQAAAGADAGQEALNTQSNAARDAAEVDRQVNDGTTEIYSRPGGDSNDAALRAACRLRQYADSERCARMREADTGRDAPAGSPR